MGPKILVVFLWRRKEKLFFNGAQHIFYMFFFGGERVAELRCVRPVATLFSCQRSYGPTG